MIYCGENMGAEQIVSKAAKQKSIEFTVLTEVRMKRLSWLFNHSEKKKIIALAIVLSLLAALLRQCVTYYLGEAVDAAGKSYFSTTVVYLGYLSIGILILMALDYLSLYFYGSFTNHNLYHFRSRTVESAIQFTLKEKAKYSTGELINRLNSDLQILEKFFRTTIGDTSYKVFSGLFAAVFGFIINYKVMFVLLSLCLITAVVNYFFAKPVEHLQQQIQTISDRIMLSFQEAIHGNKEIKAYGIRNQLAEKFGKTVKAHMQKTFSIARIESLWGAIEITVSIALQIGIVFLCLLFVTRGEMTLGDIVIFQQLVEMVKQIFVIDFVTINKVLVIIKRIEELWSHGTVSGNGRKVKSGIEEKPILEFDHVCFDYEKDNTSRSRPILSQVSFTVMPCESVAIIGPSGSGKSTIVNMICGLLNPDDGKIKFEGYDIRQWDEQTLYDEISLVDQESRLFPISIYENIACGGYGCSRLKENAIPAAVDKAIKDASLSSFIASLKEKEKTDVGEFGGKLSGGQRQRISIARALVKSPKLLILDEPTSALDAETEKDILSSLHHAVKEQSATIIVAHRLSTIQDADKILVLNHGRIEEQGNHETLMRKKGLYYRMFLQQRQKDLEVSYE